MCGIFLTFSFLRLLDSVVPQGKPTWEKYLELLFINLFIYQEKYSAALRMKSISLSTFSESLNYMVRLKMNIFIRK